MLRLYLLLPLLLLGLIRPACGQELSHVLLLNSYHYGLDWTDEETRGIRDVLEQSGQAIELHVEYMDTKRLSDEIHFQNLRQLLEYKYRNTRFSAILVADNDAFNFLRQNQNRQIFANVPVIFAGVNSFNKEMLAGISGFTGVAETFEAGQTIEVMRQLHPNVRRVVVIIDTTTTGKAIRKELEPMLTPFAGQITFEFWDTLSLEQMQMRLPTLQSDTLVLLMPFARDSAETFIRYSDIAEMVSRFSAVPVYGTYDFYMGHGVVGGRNTHAIAQGRAAANILLRVLNGEAASQIPVITVAPSEFQFDSRQLHRYGIAKSNIPPGSKVLYQTWYELYQVWVWLGALLLLITLSFGWGWWRARQQKHRSDLALRESEKKLLTVLEHSCNAIFLVRPNGQFIYANKQAESLLGYSGDELLQMSIPDTLSANELERTMAIFQRNLTGERASLETELVCKDHRHLIVELNGVLLPDGDVLEEVRDITEQKMAEQALRKSNARFAAILNATTESIFHVNEEGTILAVNTTAAHRVEKEPEDMIGLCAFDFFPTDVAATRRANLAEVFRTGKARNTEDTRNNRHFLLNYYPITGGDEKITSAVIYATEITGQKQAETALRESHQQIHQLLNSMAEGAYGVDTHGNCIFVNQSFLRLLGYENDSEVIGKHIHELIHHSHPDGSPYPADTCKMYHAYMENTHAHVTDEVFWRRDGSAIPVEYWSQPILVDNVIQGAIATFFDITERLQAETQIKKSLSLLKATLESTTDAILVVDLNNTWRLYNQQFINLWSIPEEIVASNDDNAALSFVINQLEDVAGFLSKVHDLYSMPESRSFDTFRFKDGRSIERFSIPQFVDGEVVGRVWSFRDVSARKELEEKIHQLAFYDALTSLPNRRLLSDRLSQSLASSSRTGLYSALMFLDLDNFKPLNDTHGHVAGDLLLIEVASRLKSCVRETDTAARFGGDEFVVILTGLTTNYAESMAQTQVTAEKIRATLSEHYLLSIEHDGQVTTQIEHLCTTSIGVVIFASDEEDQDAILKKADEAMYRAKESGRNRISSHD